MKKILSVFLFAFAVRLISINQSLWLDEATTALVSQRSVVNYFTQFAVGDFHPPLYYLLSMGISRLFGSSEIALRLVSIVSGVGTVFVVYKIAELFSDKGSYTPFIASIFLATSGLHIYYSQEARMYTLAALFATLSIYFYLKNSWKLFGVSILGMVLTHYVTIFMLPVFWIHGYLAQKDKKWWKRFVYSHILLIVGFGVWSPVFVKQLTGGLGVESTTPLWWNILGKTTPKEILLVPAKFFFGRITIENNMVYGMAVGLVSLVYGFITIGRRPSKVRPFKERSDLIIWLWLLLPTALTALVGLWIPVFSYFRILFVLPAIYILLAQGVSHRGIRWQKLALAFVLVVNLFSAGVYLFNPRFHREDWRELVNYVADRNVGSDQLVFVNDSQKEAYMYYFEKRFSTVASCVVENPNCANPVRPRDPATFDRESDGALWLMRYVQPIFDPQDRLRMEIEDIGFEKVSEHDFNGIVVWRYER